VAGSDSRESSLRRDAACGDCSRIACFAAAGRWIASEATFTPFFALTRKDRGRLTYLAEIDLEDPPARLPARSSR